MLHIFETYFSSYALIGEHSHRSCWRRVDELEDEEASLNHRFTRLEKVRRGKRLEVGHRQQRTRFLIERVLRIYSSSKIAAQPPNR